MSRDVPYLLCRYVIADEDGNALSADEQLALLKRLRARRIAYRNRDPGPDDEDTYIMKPRRTDIARRRVHTWEIARDLHHRELTKYDRESDDTYDEIVATEEIRRARFLALPTRNVLAIQARSSERQFGADQALARFTAVVEKLSDCTVDYEVAGTPQDVERALETWTLERFTFTVRPFNPSTSKPGELLHEILVADHAGRMNAVVHADHSHEMRDSHAGIISEVKGLSDKGYGQYGASGRTPHGLRGSITKPKFDLDRDTNLERQRENRVLKVYIPPSTSQDEADAAVVKALIDIYAEHS